MATFFKKPVLVTLGRGQQDKAKSQRAISGSVVLSATDSSPVVNVAGFNSNADVASIQVSQLNAPATFQIRSCLITVAFEQTDDSNVMLSAPVIVYNTTTGEAVFIPFQNYPAQNNVSGNPNAAPMVTACFPFYGDINSVLQIIEPAQNSGSNTEVQVSFMFFEEERPPFVISGMSTYPWGTL